MESVFNIEPQNIKERDNIQGYKYIFLDNIFTIDVHKYYQLITSIETFKIKNLYNFLFLRSLKLHNQFSIRKMDQNKYIQTQKEFDNVLTEYIQKDPLYCILIINGIQQYFIPLNQ